MSLQQTICTYLENQKKSVSVETLATGLKLEKANDYKVLVKTIAKMEREGNIVFNKKGNISLPAPVATVEGVFRYNERGFGFVTIEEDEPNVYIPKEKTNFAMNGDVVAVTITAPADPFGEQGPKGEILSIKERKMTQLVGVFHAYTDEEVSETDLYGYVVPKDKKLAHLVAYATAEGVRPVEGSVVILTISHYPETDYPTQLEGIVTKVIGHVNDVGMDILEIVHSHGIKPEFNETTLAMADKVPDKLSEKDMENRKDLREQLIVTIDGEDAKDLDDAVCVWQKENGHYHLGVHIADVSYYVTEHSPIDEEAYERATSVYLTDRVIPMIPQRLSNGICSLNPRVPRLTMSCEMEIDKTGQVVNYDIFPSVIRTTERMTYTNVNKIIETHDEETMQKYAQCVPMFEKMKELHFLLENMRNTRGAINFEDHEAKLLVDENGKVEEIVLRKRGVAEKLIESFMLLANETVARHFSEKNLPFIYRIHEHPKADKLERFFDFASVFGVVVQGTTENLAQTELQKVLTQAEGEPYEAVINTMLLRSMQQARYAEHNYGHYGLAAEYYTHFTSPIRRYPDLVVHRLIREYAESTSEKRQKKWAQLLPEIAEHTSQMERRAVDCEREVDSMKKAEFMTQHVGEEFEGVISSVAKFGFFVELPNTIEGLIHISNLDKDYFNYVERHMALVGERTGQVFKLGQKVIIKVEKADPDTREIDFSFISTEEVTTIPTHTQTSNKKTRTHEQKKNGRNRHERRKNETHHKKSGEKKEANKNFQKKKQATGKAFYTKMAKKKKR